MLAIYYNCNIKYDDNSQNNNTRWYMNPFALALAVYLISAINTRYSLFCIHYYLIIPSKIVNRDFNFILTNSDIIK